MTAHPASSTKPWWRFALYGLAVSQVLFASYYLVGTLGIATLMGWGGRSTVQIIALAGVTLAAFCLSAGLALATIDSAKGQRYHSAMNRLTLSFLGAPLVVVALNTLWLPL